MDSQKIAKSSLLIALLGDTHLRDTQYATSQRGDDFTQAFFRAIRAICEALDRPDFILHSGDLFDSSRPSPKVIGALMTANAMLVAGKMRMYCCTGNHDFTNPTWLSTLFPSDGEYGVIPVDGRTLEHEGYTIVGVPPYTAKRFLEQKAEIKEKAEHADILLYHGLVTGIVPIYAGNKKLTLDVVDLPVSENLKLIALADIHVQGHVRHPNNSNCLIVYPGSTEMCSSGELPHKSVPLIRMTKSSADIESYIQLTIRPFVTAKIRTEEELETLMTKLKPMAESHPVVVVEFERSMPQVISRIYGVLDSQRCVIRCQALPELNKGYTRSEGPGDETAELTMEHFLKQKFEDDVALQELALNLFARGEDSSTAVLTDFVNAHFATNDVREF